MLHMKLQKKNPTLNIWFSPLFFYIYQRGFKEIQVNFIGRMASTFQVTYSKIYLKFSTAGRNFKQLFVSESREFIFVNLFPQFMKILFLIDVGYIFFNLLYGSMWRVRVTESEYPLSMQSVIDHPWNDLTKHLVSHPGFLLLANNMAGCVFFPT